MFIASFSGACNCKITYSKILAIFVIFLRKKFIDNAKKSPDVSKG